MKHKKNIYAHRREPVTPRIILYNGMTAGELENITGVSDMTMRRIFQEKKPVRDDIADKIKETLGIDVPRIAKKVYLKIKKPVELHDDGKWIEDRRKENQIRKQIMTGEIIIK